MLDNYSSSSFFSVNIYIYISQILFHFYVLFFFFSFSFFDMVKFLWAFSVFLLYILACINNNGLMVQATHEVYIRYQTSPAFNIHKLHRTGYHFQPKKHWMNGTHIFFFFFFSFSFFGFTNHLKFLSSYVVGFNHA